jgi:hypothetical protein
MAEFHFRSIEASRTNFMSVGEGVTAGRCPKIASCHGKAESSIIILHCTTVHDVIVFTSRQNGLNCRANMFQLQSGK